MIDFCLTFVINDNHLIAFCIKAYTTLFSCNVLPSITFDNISYIERPFITFVDKFYQLR